MAGGGIELSPHAWSKPYNTCIYVLDLVTNQVCNIVHALASRCDGGFDGFRPGCGLVNGDNQSQFACVHAWSADTIGLLRMPTLLRP